MARLCTVATRSAMGASVGENVVIALRTSSRGSSLNCEPSESSRCHCDLVIGPDVPIGLSGWLAVGG